MADIRSGGGNYVSFYTIDATHATIGATPVFVGQLIEQTATTRAEDGVYTSDFTQLQDDAAFYTFLETYAPDPSEGGVTQVVLEDGSKKGGSVGSSPELLMIKAGASDGTNRKGFAAVVKLATASGSYTEVNGTYNKPTFQAVSQKALATIQIEGKLPTSLYLATPTVAIGLGKKGKVFFQPKSA